MGLAWRLLRTNRMLARPPPACGSGGRVERADARGGLRAVSLLHGGQAAEAVAVSGQGRAWHRLFPAGGVGSEA